MNENLIEKNTSKYTKKDFEEIYALIYSIESYNGEAESKVRYINRQITSILPIYNG